MLSKVPEVGIWFWIIKILCTTVGESFADWINMGLGGLGINKTAIIFTVVLVVVLAVQMSLKRYVPMVYWLVVVVLSVAGTLYTDILSHGVLLSVLLLPCEVSYAAIPTGTHPPAHTDAATAIAPCSLSLLCVLLVGLKFLYCSTGTSNCWARTDSRIGHAAVCLLLSVAAFQIHSTHTHTHTPPVVAMLLRAACAGVNVVVVVVVLIESGPAHFALLAAFVFLGIPLVSLSLSFFFFFFCGRHADSTHTQQQHLFNSCSVYSRMRRGRWWF